MSSRGFIWFLENSYLILVGYFTIGSKLWLAFQSRTHSFSVFWLAGDGLFISLKHWVSQSNSLSHSISARVIKSATPNIFRSLKIWQQQFKSVLTRPKVELFSDLWVCVCEDTEKTLYVQRRKRRPHVLHTVSCSTADVKYRTQFRNTTCRKNRHIFSLSSLYPFLSLLIFFSSFLFLTSFMLSVAALSAVEGTNCICRSPCNMTRYNKELSMVKIPSKTSARYLEKKFNRSEKYITWVCTSQPFEKPFVYIKTPLNSASKGFWSTFFFCCKFFSTAFQTF